MGAAAATAISYGLFTVAGAILARRHFRVDLE